MKLIKKKVSDLKDHPLNEKTRGITREALEQLKTSIDTLGTIQPIVWNKKLDCICSGHQRVKTYKSKKVKVVDVWEISLSEHDHVLAMYMLNNHFGEFDEDMLRAIVKEVRDANDISVEGLGFGEKEIENYLKEFESEEVLPSDRFCSTLVFDNEGQKKEFIKLRKKFKNSGELAGLAETKLKSWTA